MTENKFTFQLRSVVSSERNSNANESTHEPHIHTIAWSGGPLCGWKCIVWTDAYITFVARNLIISNAVRGAFYYGDSMICAFEGNHKPDSIVSVTLNTRMIHLWLDVCPQTNFRSEPSVKLLSFNESQHDILKHRRAHRQIDVDVKSMYRDWKSSCVLIFADVQEEAMQFVFKLHLLIGFLHRTYGNEVICIHEL